MLVLISLLGFVSVSARADIDCEKGFERVSKIQTSDKPWSEFFDYFQKYIPKCDDGYYAEGTSDLTMKLLADWKDFAGLKQTSHQSESFFNYVLKNINATGDKKDLGMIMVNAKKKCPKENRKLCQRIGKSAANAVKEMESK